MEKFLTLLYFLIFDYFGTTGSAQDGFDKTTGDV
jgi:hypothetical protein